MTSQDPAQAPAPPCPASMTVLYPDSCVGRDVGEPSDNDQPHHEPH
jgi:hypothetical protein